MGYFEALETRARLIEILAEFIDSDAPGILLNLGTMLKSSPPQLQTPESQKLTGLSSNPNVCGAVPS